LSKAREKIMELPETIAGEIPDNKKFDALLKAIQEEYGISLKPEKNKRYLLNRIKSYLAERYEFRFNLFAKKPEWRKINKDGNSADEFEYFEERDIDNIYNALELDENISIGVNRLVSLIGSNKVSRDYNAITEYVLNLQEWDGVDRFPELLNQIKLKNETAAERAFLVKYFTKWFVTLVASLIDKDVINEVAVIFTGNEGRGKTRFFNSLIPKDLRLKYFYCGTFDPREKDHREMLGTKILIQLDEMETMNRVESGILKSTLSTRYVVLRRAFGRGNIHLYRNASFAGTINDDKFLLDTGANRRWLPFTIEDINIDESFNIDLLYAQALHIFRNRATNGFMIYYDRDEIDEFKKRNESYRYLAPEEALITLYWTIPTDDDLIKKKDLLRYMTASDVMHELASMEKYKKMNTNDSVARRIGKILSNLGFKQKKCRLPGYVGSRDAYIMLPRDLITADNIIKGRAEEDEEEIPAVLPF
jgi:predicted P-loop ATPase